MSPIKLMKDLVLDASVAVKWFVVEEGRPKARNILKDLQLGLTKVYVPQIFFFEIANVFSFHVGIFEDDLNEHLETLFSLGIKSELTTKEFIATSLEAAKKFKITSYDAAYVALAQLLNVDLITADKKLKDKVKLTFVKLL